MKRSITLLLSLSLAGCALHHPASSQATRPTRHEDPVIVKLVARESSLIARASKNGPTYSVESNAGEVIVPPQTLNVLRAERPALAHEVQTLEANAWAGL